MVISAFNARMLTICRYVCFASTALGTTVGAPAELVQRSHVVGPYCGLYSAARLVSLLDSGRAIDVRQYASTEYVSSRAGSTPDQISGLLMQNGVTVKGLQGLSGIDLLSSSTPWIANVRRHPDAMSYQHWVCVHPSGRKVVVYDGAASPQHVDLGEFLAVWNGFALIPTGSMGILSTYISRLCLLLIVVSVLVATTKVYGPNLTLTGRVTTGTCALAIMSFAFGADPLHHFAATRTACAPWTPDVATVNLDRLVEAARRGEQLVDARYERDFERGTLPGAVSVPVNVSIDSVKARTAALDPRAETFVFCQSLGCPFDQRVAKRLSVAGFQNVRAVEGGWVEYLQLDRNAVTRARGEDR